MLLQKAAGKECCLVRTSEEGVGNIAMVLMCTGNNYNYVFNELKLAYIGLIKMYIYPFGVTANVYWWMDNMSQIGSWA